MQQTRNNGTALLWACQKKNEDAIGVLLNAGANPNIPDDGGNACLHMAVYGGCNRDVLQAIIEHGVDVNARSNGNQTALFLACQNENVNTIYVLLKSGGDPNIADIDDETSLNKAVGGHSRNLIQELIDHAADVNATNKSNVTALMIACERGNVEAINVLLDAGADTDIADNYGATWIHHAVAGVCSKDVLQVIIDHGTDVNARKKNNATALMIACGRGNMDAINVLLNAGADTGLFDDIGATWIHHAVARACSKDVLHVIIDHGTDINAGNENNVTALMIACGKGNVDSINVLLHAEADPNSPDNNGNTCLHYAVDGLCSKEVLQIIIVHGADVNATN